jgi:hypothetical protein
MRITIIAVASLLLGGTLPVGSELPGWVGRVEAEKPFVLEIAYGETQAALPRRQSDVGVSVLAVTEEFLNQAKRIKLGVSSEEGGTIERDDGCKITFKLQKADAGFLLQIFLQATQGGTRTLNTRIVLSPAQWVVASGHAIESPEQDRAHFYVAIRIEHRG